MPPEEVPSPRPLLGPILRGVVAGLGPVIFLTWFLSAGAAEGLPSLGAGELLAAILQRILLLLIAAVIPVICGFFGMSLQRSASRPLPDQWVMGCGIGLGALSLITLGLGLAGALNAISAMVVLAAMTVIGIPSIGRVRRRLRSADRRRVPFSSVESLLLIVMVFVATLTVIISMRPPADYDAREYHMACPARWFQLGRIDYVEGNVYSNFPMNAEMLYLFGISLVGRLMPGVHLGMVLNAIVSILAGMAVFVASRRIVSRRCALAATALFLTMPQMLISGAVNLHNEPLLAFYATLAVLALLEFLESTRAASAALCGLFAGFAAGVKYTALAFFPVVMGLSIVATARGRSPVRRLRLGAFALAVAFVAAAPWLVKNAAMTSNPVYPFFYDRLGGGDWSGQQAQKWIAGQMKAAGAREVSNPLIAVWKRVIANPWGSPGLVLFALLGALSVRERSVRWLVVLLVLWTIFWYAFTHRVERFYLPMVGAAAVLSARGIATLATGRLRVALAAMLVAALGWQVFVDVLQTSNAPPSYDILNDSERFFRATHDRFFPVVLFERRQPGPGRLMLIGEAQTLFLPPGVMASTVFDREVFTSTVGDAHDPEQVRERLKSAGVTRLFVHWGEIGRLRQTYAWTDREGVKRPGFPDLHPSDFRRLVDAGVLVKLSDWSYGRPDPKKELRGLSPDDLRELPDGKLCVFYRVESSRRDSPEIEE